MVEVPRPHPGPGEALIRTRLAGICGTDLEIGRGYLDFRGIPGHEFVGEVVEAPSPGWRGRRVVGEINLACGACRECRAGLRTHCPNRTVLGIQGKDGAFAEYVTLPLENLHPVPDPVGDEAAVFTEPLAAAFEILEQIPNVQGRRTLVVGPGRLGQLCARILHEAGADLTAAGGHPHKRRLLEARGIRTVAAPPQEPTFDLAVEATGSPAALESALAALRPRGVLVLKSTYHGKVAWEPAWLVIHEWTLLGSRCGPFPTALKRLEQDPSIVTDLVSHRVSMWEPDRAFALATQRESLKVLLVP